MGPLTKVFLVVLESSRQDTRRWCARLSFHNLKTKIEKSYEIKSIFFWGNKLKIKR
jgi:hypothetical protein